MKPSIKRIKEKMGDGRAPSKQVVAKEIQRVMNQESMIDTRGILIGMMWIFSGKSFSEINEDIKDLFKDTL